MIFSKTIYLWLRHVIHIAILMLLRTLVRKLFRVTMLQYTSSSRNLQIDDTRANVFPVGCPNIPIWVTSCSNFMMTKVSLLTHFEDWPSLKFSYMKPRRLRNESYRSKYLTASGQSFSSHPLLFVPIEIGILRHSIDVVKLGSLLVTVLIHFPLIVLISTDLAIFLLALLVKILKHVKLKSPLPWAQTEKVMRLDVGMANVHDATRNLC